MEPPVDNTGLHLPRGLGKQRVQLRRRDFGEPNPGHRGLVLVLRGGQLHDVVPEVVPAAEAAAARAEETRGRVNVGVVHTHARGRGHAPGHVSSVASGPRHVRRSPARLPRGRDAAGGLAGAGHQGRGHRGLAPSCSRAPPGGGAVAPVARPAHVPPLAVNLRTFSYTRSIY